MRKIFLSLALVVAFVTTTTAQKQLPPPPGPAPKIELGKYEFFELKNGLKVYVVENRKLPTVAMSLVLDIDPVFEGDKNGYADAAGSMLRTGTKTRTKDQIDEEVDFVGAYLSTSASGFNAGGLKKHLNTILAITSDVVQNPQFKQEELDKYKQQAISGLASAKNDPNQMMATARKALLFGQQHPYGESATEKTIENITLADVEQFYNTYYKPNVGYLAIVGDVSAKEMKPLIKKYFGKWKKGNVPKSTLPAVPAVPATKVAIIDRPNSVQSVIAVANTADLKPGTDDAITAKVMNTLLGGSFFRLTQNLREKHGYTYGSNSALTSDKHIGAFYAFASVRNAVTDSAIHEMLYELNRLRTEKVEQAELQKVKNTVSGEFARSLEDPQTVAMFAINTARYNIPKDYYANYLKKVEAVTPDMIMAAANKYIRPENSYIIAVGNATEIAPKLTRFSTDKQVGYYNMYGDKVERREIPIPAGVTTESVLAQYIAAIGGKSNLEKVKDLTVKSSASIQGTSLTITTTQKGTDKFYQDVKVGDMQVQKMVINGAKGKMYAGGQSQELTGEVLADQKVEADFLVELKGDKAGIQRKLIAVDNIDGRDVYLVEIVLPSGKKGTHYFDKETSLKVREVTNEEGPMGPMTKTVDLKNYKEVKGIKYPHSQVMTVGPQTIDSEVTTIEINKGVKDDQFKLD